jgi:serine/threonine protein kinase/formylglycine-generating enzyme required for sulfatase activity
MSAEKFGEYEVQKREDGSLFELGRGAMGVTYKAFDTHLHRFVALKTISPAILAHPDAEERFTREARSAAQLRHPNIAAVFRRDKTPGGTHYYAMELCDGQTIEQLVKQEGALDWRRALEIAAQAANALAAAARRNLIHRDLKPSNLMLVREFQGEDQAEGEVLKVIDFGLAKISADDGAAWSSIGTQGFVGTAHFASPEQIQSRFVDTRTDIYSLGATLWFMLVGSPPFTGSVWEVINKHVNATPDFSLLSAQPEMVVDLIREMMAKNPADRPQTAKELLDKIKECLHCASETESMPAPPPEPVPEAAVTQDMPAPQKQRTPSGWAPTLRDLLRARGALERAEALYLGEALATFLDEGDRPGALMIQGISIHFCDPSPESESRAMLRERVTAWPRFNLAVSVRDQLAGSEADTVVSCGMQTVLMGGDSGGDRVQQLARLLYELLGGVAGSQHAPLASLDENGNAVLQRGIAKGQGEYPRARDLIDAFGAAKADSPLPRTESRGEPTAGPVATESARYSYKPLQEPRREPSVRRPETKVRTSTRKKWSLVMPAAPAIAGAAAAVALTLLALFGWSKFRLHGRTAANAAHTDNPTPLSAPDVAQGEGTQIDTKTPAPTVTPKKTLRSGGVTASKKSPFVNSLHMEFVPAGTRGVLFCRTDTRVRDFRQYAEETKLQQDGGIYGLKIKTSMDDSHSLEWGLDAAGSWERPGFSQTDDDPVVGVSWDEARDFCEWLSVKEGRRYRLPTDEEWSAAVGNGIYPWGNAWPPGNGSGNYADLSFLNSLPGKDWKNELGNYYDSYPRTSPAGKFKPNVWGLFDMGGNVWQWCEDKYRASMNNAEILEKYPSLRNEKASDGTPYRVVRGGAWDIDDPIFLRSTFRNIVRPTTRGDAFGFRCVLVTPSA